MGFLSRFLTPQEKPAVDPQAELIKELLEDSREQRKEMMALVAKVMDQQAQSQFLQQQLMQQYVAKGENQTTTLDSRLFTKQEKLEDEMWENIGESPFKALGLVE